MSGARTERAPAHRSALPKDARIVIAGAGFAGAATAASLVRRGYANIVILEAEAVPGAHGSGRNAAMARRVLGDALMTHFAAEGMAGIEALGRRRGVRLLDPVGGVLLGATEIITRHERAGRSDARVACALRRLPAAELAREIEAIEATPAADALVDDAAGVVDIHALLSELLAEAREGGATLYLDAVIEAIGVDAGRVRRVTAGAQTFPADVLVDAAGFGANHIAELAGANALPFGPSRRHLFVAASWPEAIDAGRARRWPFLWDITHGVYFRPEGAGLLMCACDETAWPGALPPTDGPPTDPTERERLAEAFSSALPRLAGSRPSRVWAGIRVKTPDDRVVIGFDRAVGGLFWVAGLGGHGMTTSCAVGEVAAEGLARGVVPAPWGQAFDPGRLSD